MASASAAPPPSNVLTGARATMLLEGRAMGYGSQVSVAQSYSYSPIQTLGNLEVQGHVPTSYSVSLTFNQLRLIGTNLVTQGYWPNTDGGPTDHLRALSAIPPLTCTIEDSVTSTVVAVILGVRIESSQLSLTAGGLWGEDISAVATRMILQG